MRNADLTRAIDEDGQSPYSSIATNVTDAIADGQNGYDFATYLSGTC